MNILDLLQGQMSDGVVEQLSNQIRSDKERTTAAANGIFATLVSALSRNVASPQGGSALLGALDRDHDGSVLDDIMGFLSAGNRPANTRAANGLGILDHVLGGKTDNVVQMVSKSSGLDLLKTGQLMQLLAPMVMGALGKAKRQENLDAGGLAGLLSGTVSKASQGRQDMGIIAKVLDADGDGNVMDDIAGMGIKMLGNMFKNK
jgi:hypothetical protein